MVQKVILTQDVTNQVTFPVRYCMQDIPFSLIPKLYFSHYPSTWSSPSLSITFLNIPYSFDLLSKVSKYQHRLLPLPKQVLHQTRSAASSLISLPYGHPIAAYVFFLVSHNFCPIIPSLACFRRPLLRKMWQIQLSFLFVIVCKIFLSSLITKLHFSLYQSAWSSSPFLDITFLNIPGNSDLLSKVSKYQHRTELCFKCRTSRYHAKNNSDLLVNRAFLLNADKLGKVKK
jgi:hypothetical protein